MPRSLASLGLTGRLMNSESDGTTIDDILAQNQNSRERLASAGLDDPTEKKGPSALERILGPFDALGAGVRSLVYNAAAPENVNPLEEMLKAAKGEERIEGADVLDALGLTDDDTNKWVKMLGGIAVDVALDPLTYLTWGYSAAAKQAGKTAVTKLAKEGGLVVDDLARILGRNADDLAKSFASQMADEADEVAEIAARLLSGEQKVALPMLDDAMSNAVKHATFKGAAGELGEQGGMKLFGKTVLPVQGKLDKASDLLRTNAVSKSPLGEWFSKAFMPYGDKIPGGANSLERIFIPRMEKEYAGVVSKGRAIGAKFRKDFEKALPDEKARDIFTIAIGREFGDVPTRQGIDEMYQAVKAAKEAGDEAAIASAESSLRETLAATYDQDAVAKAFAEAGYDEATIATAREMQGKYHAFMDELASLRESAGLPSWTLYGEYLPEGVADSAGYARGQGLRQEANILGLPTKATKESLASQDAAMKSLGVGMDDIRLSTDDLLDVKPRGTGAAKLHLEPKAYKSKAYKDAERAMVDGGLLQDLDVARLSEAKATSDYVDIAAKGLSDSLTSSGLPTEQAEELARLFRGVFNEDEAVTGFFRTFDKIQNAWKRAATAMRLGAFQNRNMFSNKILQAIKGVLDPESEMKSLDLMQQIARGVKTVDDPEVVELIRLGVIQSAEEFAEQVRGGKFTSLIGTVGGEWNALVENQARIGSFYAGLKKGLDPESAARLVDDALYDYSNVARTAFEKSVMMRVVPFYKWMRQNVPNMLETLVKEPGKLSWLGHVKQSGEAVTDYDKSSMPDWLRDLYPIPLPMGEDGEPVMLSTAGLFPQGDLEILSGILGGKFDPKDAFGTMSPLIRTPMELLFNKDLFYDSEIARYEGEKKRVPNYVEKFGDLASAVPGLGEVWSLIADRLGIQEREDDNGNAYYYANAYSMKALRDFAPWMNQVSKVLDEQRRTPYDRFAAFTGIKPVLFESERFAKQQAYDDRAELQDSILRARDEGVLPEGKTVSIADLFRR